MIMIEINPLPSGAIERMEESVEKNHEPVSEGGGSNAQIARKSADLPEI